MTFEPIASPGKQDTAHLLAKLGTTLVETGAIDRRTLDRARRVASETGGRLDQVLTQLGLMSDRGLAEALAELIAAPVVVASDYPDRPLFQDRLYAELAESGDAEEMLDEVLPDAEPAEEDAERLKDLASEAPVIRLVNQLIARAVETRASDVHLEPLPDRLRVRYRYDGILHEVEAPPGQLQAAVISRIKIMSRLDIAERRLPQDGRIRLTVRGHEIDLRISTIPSLYGESVVLRVLDRAAVELDYAKLGFSGEIEGGLRRALDLPNGMVL